MSARSVRLSPLVLFEVVPLGLCEDLVAEFRHGVPRPRGPLRSANPMVRVCEYVTVSPRYVGGLDDRVGDAVDRAWRVATDRAGDPPLVICRYGPGDECRPHRDEVIDQDLTRARAAGQPVVNADLTVVVFLNAPPRYQGGGVVFGNPPKQIEPAAGGLAAFPTRIRYGVGTVTAGERFTLLTRRNLRTTPRSPIRPTVRPPQRRSPAVSEVSPS